MTDRKTVFLSHANPADNQFTQWLTLRLAREGYEVWCDLTKLLGGDDFWSDIEQALRQRARKVVYILSRASNQAGGVLKEIAVANGIAKQLKDTGFIIPVKIDDLPFADHNIEINRLNAISFTKGWAEGLAALLKTLQDDGVPRSNNSGPSVVASWWNDRQLNKELVHDSPQAHWTNWFPVKSIPSAIWVWRAPQGWRAPDKATWPAYRIDDRYVSFASSKELTRIDRSPTGGRGVQIAMDLNAEPPSEAGLSRAELRTAVKQLLRQSWDLVAERRKLPLYQLSSRRRTLWFPSGSVSPNGVAFTGTDGKRADRQLYGFKSVGPKGAKYKRHYHYGLEAQILTYPDLILALKSHVIFTKDGSMPLRDPAFQHRARRSQCKAWWNDRWRDLLFASMAALTGEKDDLTLPLSEKTNASISTRPLELISPVSYLDEDVKEPSEEQIGGGEDAEPLDDVSEDGVEDE